MERERRKGEQEEEPEREGRGKETGRGDTSRHTVSLRGGVGGKEGGSGREIGRGHYEGLDGLCSLRCVVGQVDVDSKKKYETKAEEDKVRFAKECKEVWSAGRGISVLKM